MSALCIPKTVIKAIDKRRRAFFWTGEDKCHGAKCLVAWESVQAPKKRGGLGIKDLELQNKCLLMKFINKLFSEENPSWKSWVLTNAPFDSLSSQSCSYLWKIVNNELNSFRSITYVKVQNGAATSFWFDRWTGDGPLFSSHTALFSHTTRPNVSVQYVFQSGFDLHLRPRLTTAASQQLCHLLESLQEITLTDGHDVRLLKLTDRAYTTRDAYAALDCGGDADDYHGRLIWQTKVPNKVKVFAWLYFKDRLSTRTNLFSKHIVDSCLCERCGAEEEDRQHVFFGCSDSRHIWVSLNLEHICDASDTEVWEPELPSDLDAKLWPFVLLTILWRIWDARNGHIFSREIFSSRAVLCHVRDDLVTWRKRLPPHFVNSLMGWHSRVCTCISTLAQRHG
jgi:hypothetical protein